MAQNAKLSAFCKFNLFLRVLDFDAEAGKHNLFSLFVRSPQLRDEITITEVAALHGGVRVIYLDDRGNALRFENCLIKRSLDRLVARHRPERLPGLLIEVKKGIPAGSGLGGGSSDAAAVMNWFYRRFDVMPALREDWRTIAAELGSDIPFFLSDAPSAYVSGIGDHVARIDATPPNHEIIITDIVCPTDAVFAAHKRLGAPSEPLLNDLMPAAFSVCPELKEAYAKLRARHANVVMTGAGSAFVSVSVPGESNEQSAH